MIENEEPHLGNHYDIFVDYHQVRQGEFRVVGIIVEPRSRGSSKRTGSGTDMSADCGDEHVPQVLSEKDFTDVTWTYSVYWQPSPSRLLHDGTNTSMFSIPRFTGSP
ncbi:hypothetical protein MRB53_041334 [Persea americana]|nr:hypothetical protein MRB53_041334 [Persea americana]